MIGTYLLTVVLFWLVIAAWTKYPAAKREARIEAAFDRAAVDDHQCETCGNVTTIRELVMLHDDATLACPGCAELLKVRRGRLERAA